MSSPEGSSPEGSSSEGPPAEEITDPALAAEVDDPGASNLPTGAEAAPGDNVTAADQDPIPAAGAPGALSSDQTPAQGGERGETVPAESVGEVAGGDAGSPESGPNAEARPTGPPPTGPGTDLGAAVVSDQPSVTPSVVAVEGAAVQQATEEKVAQAVVAREVAAAAEESELVESDEARQHLIETLQRVLGDAVEGSHLMAGVDVWVRVRVDAWRHALELCRDELGLTYFCYLSAIDWLPSPYGRSEDAPPAPAEGAAADTGASEAQTGVAARELEHGYAGGATRFQLLARVVSPTTHVGLTLKADLDDDAPAAPSIIDVYPGADWHEREAWEMYGIDFAGHPNLIKLYLPGAFEGHPLRKDFPLLAREVKPWPGLVDVEAMPDDVVTGEAATGEGATT